MACPIPSATIESSEFFLTPAPMAQTISLSAAHLESLDLNPSPGGDRAIPGQRPYF
jgi:hypothetical protein